MEEKAKRLLAAVKKDDLAAFKKEFNKDTEKYSFGRFPLLSLCYLYGSYKIALTYERKLLALSRYTIVEEDRESYYLFRKRAHRVLRLYVGGQKIVSPLSMLAILGRHDSLKALYPVAYKDEAIREEIAYAAQTLYGSSVSFGRNSIRIRRQNATRLQKITTYAACALSVVMIACALLGYFLMPNDKGTADSPVAVDNGKQLVLALKNDGYYTLTDDVEMTIDPGTEFKGSLNGNGHKISLSASSAGAAFAKTVGTIKDVEFVVDAGNVEVGESTALFIAENTGTLENVKVTVKGSLAVKAKESSGEGQEKETVYISAFVGKNSGAVSGCEVTCDLTANNPSGTNAYLSGLVSENTGTVSQCKTNGKISADTTDVAGLVAENKEGGVISDCMSDTTLSQESTKTGWSPNVAGLCLHNYGTISESKFSGAISVKCTVEKEGTEGAEETVETVYAGGTCCINEGEIDSCVFDGKIDCEASGALLQGGGITCYNVGKVNECASSGEIKCAGTKDARLYVGGIVGVNYVTVQESVYVFGTLTNCSSSVKEELISSDDNSIYAGGLVGFNNSGKVIGGDSSAQITSKAPSAILGGAVGYNTSNVNEIVYFYSSSVGVFGVVSTATVTATTEESVEVTKETYVGGITGYSSVALSECGYTGTLTGGDKCLLGGIAGYNYYQLVDCQATCTINAGSNGYVGGISGAGQALIQNCFATLTATVKDECNVGGVVGRETSKVYLCAATLNVTAGQKTMGGGVVGRAASSSFSVVQSEATGTLVGGEESVLGGIVGSLNGNNSEVRVCYSSVSLTAGASALVGGVVGSNDKGRVRYSFSASGMNAGEGSFIGGIIGSVDGASVNYTYNYKDSNREKFTQSYIQTYGEDDDQRETKVESALEQYLSAYGYYYKNAYVGESLNGFGKITDYDDAPADAYNTQATRYATEDAMKQGDEYKGVYGNETD